MQAGTMLWAALSQLPNLKIAERHNSHPSITRASFPASDGSPNILFSIYGLKGVESVICHHLKPDIWTQ